MPSTSNRGNALGWPHDSRYIFQDSVGTGGPFSKCFWHSGDSLDFFLSALDEVFFCPYHKHPTPTKLR